MKVHKPAGGTKAHSLSWAVALGVCAACGSAVYLLEPNRLAREGAKLLKRKRYHAARAVFSLLMRRAPRDRRGYEGAAEALVRLGDADRAFAVLTQGAESIMARPL